MTLLSDALKTCKVYGLNKKKAKVCCELSGVVLPCDPLYALEVADAAISTDPNYERVSYIQ